MMQAAKHDVYRFTYLQRPTSQQLQEFILCQFELLHREYIQQRGLISNERLVEVAFSELEAAPLEVLSRVYKHFG